MRQPRGQIFAFAQLLQAAARPRAILGIERGEHGGPGRQLSQYLHGIHEDARREGRSISIGLHGDGKVLSAGTPFQFRQRIAHHLRISYFRKIGIESEGAAREGERFEGILAAQRSRRLVQ